MSSSFSPLDEKNLPEAYPSEWIDRATLRDGTLVTIRPIRPDDAPRLQAGFARLSPQSIYLRFLESYKVLTDKQAKEFATLDYQNRMAFVAEILEDGQKNIIGVARYAMLPSSEPGLAESAIVVIDEYQRRGLGLALMERLVTYARTHGVRVFLATVHHTNSQIMRFIGRSGFPTEKKILEPGVWEVRIILEGET